MLKYFIYFVGILLLMGCTGPMKDPSGKSIPVQLNTYIVKKDKTAPTVIIGHGSAGVRSGEETLAYELNKWGYNAIIVDHYTLRGIAPHTGQRAAGAWPHDRANDFIETAKWIVKQPWHEGKIAVVGFSQGGAGVLALATLIDTGHISSAAAFYPACLFQNTPSKPSIPVQLHLAGRDNLALPWLCTERNNPAYELHYYEEATHSFDVNIPVGASIIFRHEFDPALRDKSRQHLKTFLSTHLK